MSLKDIQQSDLVKITGKSNLTFEEKPFLIVLEKNIPCSKFSYNEFLLFCIESNRIFYWNCKENSYENIVKVQDYYKDKKLEF